MSRNNQTHHTGDQPRTDCCGVSVDVLLGGQESECPQCEGELSNVRSSQVTQREFSASSEVDRVMNWPIF